MTERSNNKYVGKDEDEAVRVAVKCIRGVSPEELRIVKIKNTLELETIEVSPEVLKDISQDARISLKKDGRN